MRARRFGAPGFTLLETLVVVGLTVILLALGFGVARTARAQADPRSLALQLLGDLNWARQTAITQGLVAGIFLPPGTAAGTYAVVGTLPDAPGRLAVHRINTWQGDDNPPCIFSGTWGTPPAASTASAPAEPGLPVDESMRSAMIALTREHPGRYIMFAPNGTMHGWGLPAPGPGVSVVVCAGARFSGDTLQAAGPGCTIHVSALGESRLEVGIPGFATSSEPMASTEVATLPPTFPRPNASPPASGGPENVAIEVVSSQRPFQPGSPARAGVVRQDGTLSVSVSAASPRGDRLYCTWGAVLPVQPAPGSAPTSPPPAAALDAGVGVPSAQGLQPMHLDPSTGRFTASVDWQPPENSAGKWYWVGAAVDDRQGMQQVSWVPVQVVGSNAARIAYLSVDPRSGRAVTILATSGGTEQRVLPATSPERPLFFSPDGNWLMLESGGRLRAVETDSLEADSADRSAMQMGTGASTAVLSADGTRICYVANPDESGMGEVFLANWDGTDVTLLTSGAVRGRSTRNVTGATFVDTVGTAPAFGPSGLLAFCEKDSFGQTCHRAPIATPEHPLPDGGGGFVPMFSVRILDAHSPLGSNREVYSHLCWGLSWVPDRGAIVLAMEATHEFSSFNSAQSDQNETRVASFTGFPALGGPPPLNWSPDGTRVAWTTSGETFYALARGTPPLSIEAPTRIANAMTHSWSADSSALLVVGSNGQADIVDVRSGIRRSFLENTRYAVWSPIGTN